MDWPWASGHGLAIAWPRVYDRGLAIPLPWANDQWSAIFLLRARGDGLANAWPLHGHCLGMFEPLNGD
eukprot:10176734-Lingulodinium_polyedra.AAC.1